MRIAILAALTILAACGAEPPPGGLTDEESRQLNEAAEMLDSAATQLPEPSEPATTGDLPVVGNAAVDAQ